MKNQFKSALGIFTLSIIIIMFCLGIITYTRNHEARPIPSQDNENYSTATIINNENNKLVVGICNTVKINIYATLDTVIIRNLDKHNSQPLLGHPIGLANNSHTLICKGITGGIFYLTKVQSHPDSFGHIEQFVILKSPNGAPTIIFSHLYSCEKAKEIIEKELN